MIYLSNVLHLPGSDIQHPYWDTLIGLLNKDTSPVTARIRLWNEDDGTPVIWPNTGETHFDQILQPQSSFAATFIPGNGFANPPQNFRGHGTIEVVKSTPFGSVDAIPTTRIWCMLSGNNWDNKSPSCYMPTRKQLDALQDWDLAYAIPNFEDGNHPGPNAYATGLAVQNFEEFPVTVTVKYTVNQCYAEHGRSWSFTKDIPDNGGIRVDLATELRNAGMPADLNSEGHVGIVANRSARLYPTAIIATKDYIFSAGASFAE